MSSTTYALRVKTPYERIITVNIKPGDTIKQVKQQILEQETIPISEQQLFGNGEELADDTQRLDLPSIRRFLRHGHLTLVLQAPDPVPPPLPGRALPVYQISVKTLTGLIITLDITEGETIADVKRKIFEKEGYPVDQQRLVHSGREWKDREPLDGRILHDFGDGGLRLVLQAPDPVSPPLPGRALPAAQPRLTFRNCMAHMRLSRELRRLNDDSKTKYGLAKALVDIELRYLENTSKARRDFDFDKLQPAVRGRENKHEAAVRRARKEITSLESMIGNGWASEQQVAPRLQEATSVLQDSIRNRNLMYIQVAIRDLAGLDVPEIIELLQRYL